jgi:hypothetical protein
MRLFFTVVLLLSALTCGSGVVVIVACYAITSSLTAARNGPGLQDLLTTPVPKQTLVHALFRVQILSGWAYFPALVIANAKNLLSLSATGMSVGILGVPALALVVKASLLVAVALVVAALQWWFIVSISAFCSMRGNKPVTQAVRAILSIAGLHFLHSIAQFAVLMTLNYRTFSTPGTGTPVFNQGFYSAYILFAAFVLLCYVGFGFLYQRKFVKKTTSALRAGEASTSG